jgi:hypothetical protein
MSDIALARIFEAIVWTSLALVSALTLMAYVALAPLL